MTLLYNFVMLAVDVWAVWLLVRHQGLIAWCNIMTCAGMAAVILGGVLGGFFEDHFGVICLWSYGVFLHGVILLLATVVLWWKTHRRLAIVAFLGAIAVVIIAIDAFLIEPEWLEITHYRIASPKIHRPIRIVVVADFQAERIGRYQEEVLRLAKAEKPDLILLVGDYLQTPAGHDEAAWAKLRALLLKVNLCETAKAFAVHGNCDPNKYLMPKIFGDTGIRVISEKQTIDLDDLQLTCVSFAESSDRSLVVKNAKPEQFHIVMGHSPNFALGKIDANLLVAGHTHGGQVQIPGIGPLITHSRVPLSWAAGMTDLPKSGKLFVSRGVGMERGYAPRMRFLCRPELAVIDLVPEEKAD